MSSVTQTFDDSGTVLDLVSRAAHRAIAMADAEWRRHRTRRALMDMSDRQRKDCGIDCPDIPTSCHVEASARRHLTTGMPSDWR